MVITKTNKLISILLMTTFLFSCNEKAKSQKKAEIPQATEFKPLATNNTRMLLGQQVYVPIYSSIYNQYEGNLLHMTAILSLRNTSFKESITIKKVDYFDTNGKLIKSYIKQPFSLSKMSSKDFVIAENDMTGGTGANFIVEWESSKKVSTPLIESVMLGTIGSKGFSFSSRGKEIESH